MKTRLLVIGLVVILGSGLYSQTATAPTTGDGSSGNPYEIVSLENLYWLSQNSGEWGKYYIQTADINASASSGWDGGSGWTPIGNNTTKFSGTYNGQNHSISGIYISRSTSNYQGLFGYTDAGTIQNLRVTSVNITGQQSVGGLVGFARCTISGCSSAGSVTGTLYTGGLAGVFYGATMSGCASNCTVAGNNSVGGLVGRNYSPVSTSFSTGSVAGTKYCGGLIGENIATVSNCYSRASVTANLGLYIGGFVASNSSSGTIQYCYSTGKVTCVGPTNKGFSGSSGGTYTANFFDSQTSGQTSGSGATAKTTAEMQTPSTFTDAGWDFDTVWEMIGTNYPRLRSNPDASLSVGLVSFSARENGEAVILDWATESEVDNLGFILERSVGVVGSDWQTIASYQTHDALKGQGNTSSRTKYTFTDRNVEFGETYQYRLSDVDIKGKITAHPPVIIELTPSSENPKETALERAYPNPFNPETFIAYHLAEDSNVNISVFDLLGRQVKMLYAGQQFAGSYHVYWNGENETGIKAPSGGYIIRMQTENTTQVQKVMLVK